MSGDNDDRRRLSARYEARIEQLQEQLANSDKALHLCFADLNEAKDRVYRMKILLRGYMSSNLEHADERGVSKDGLGNGDPCDCHLCVETRALLASSATRP